MKLGRWRTRSQVRAARLLALAAALALSLSGCATIELLTRDRQPSPPPPSPEECLSEPSEFGQQIPLDAFTEAVWQSGFVSRDSSVSAGYNALVVNREACPESLIDEELIACAAAEEDGRGSALGRDVVTLAEHLSMVESVEIYLVAASDRDMPPVNAWVTVWHTSSQEDLAAASGFLDALSAGCPLGSVAWSAQEGSLIAVDLVAPDGVMPVAPDSLDQLMLAFGAIDTPLRAASGWESYTASSACVSPARLEAAQHAKGLDAIVNSGLGSVGEGSSLSGSSYARGAEACRGDAPDVEAAACQTREFSDGTQTLWRDREALTEWVFHAGMDAVLFEDLSMRTPDGAPLHLEASAWRYPPGADAALSRLQSIIAACAEPPLAVISVDETYFVVVEQVTKGNPAAHRTLSASELAAATEVWALAVTPFVDVIID